MTPYVKYLMHQPLQADLVERPLKTFVSILALVNSKTFLFKPEALLLAISS